jgi:hypothetical protein
MKWPVRMHRTMTHPLYHDLIQQKNCWLRNMFELLWHFKAMKLSKDFFDNLLIVDKSRAQI